MAFHFDGAIYDDSRLTYLKRLFRSHHIETRIHQGEK